MAEPTAGFGMDASEAEACRTASCRRAAESGASCDPGNKLFPMWEKSAGRILPFHLLQEVLHVVELPTAPWLTRPCDWPSSLAASARTHSSMADPAE